MRPAPLLLGGLLALSGCAARTGADAAPGSLLRLGTADSLTLCEGMTRHLGVGVSWAGSTQPDVAGLPEIRWWSTDARVVRVDSLTGGITALRPGSARVVVHGRLGSAYGRTTLPVTVLAGKQDREAWTRTGRLECRPSDSGR